MLIVLPVDGAAEGGGGLAPVEEPFETAAGPASRSAARSPAPRDLYLCMIRLGKTID